jgi:hypothetical protein
MSTTVRLQEKSNREGTGLLRRALLANAAFSALSGIALMAGSAAWHQQFGLGSPWVLIVVGASLLVFAARAVFVAGEPAARGRDVRVITGMDLSWVAGSVLVLAFEPLQMTLAGRLAVAVVAGLVTAFAAAQVLGLRRLRRAGS